MNSTSEILDSIDSAFAKKQEMIHVRFQQRNSKKSVTTIEGLARDLDLNRILKALKHVAKCGGTIVQSEEHGKVIQLQGDHRDLICNFLTKEEIVPSKKNIQVYGAEK
jgi:translation initiation factor 1